MTLFPNYDDTALYFSMVDEQGPWSRRSIKPFPLDGREWQTAEHYYQAMRFADEVNVAAVCDAHSAQDAVRLGKGWFKRKRRDWKALRVTMMTRAIYTQCQIYPDMARALLETDEQILVESSQYDYFWGCGRDRRGSNHYGKILMNIRAKLSEV